jgi:hypothetical protein
MNQIAKKKRKCFFCNLKTSCLEKRNNEIETKKKLKNECQQTKLLSRDINQTCINLKLNKKCWHTNRYYTFPSLKELN